MASFTVRVELHNAVEKDYTTLHEKMKGAGFSREIVSDKGKRCHLPPGEYILAGSYNRASALKKASDAATATGKKFAVFVTESKGWRWFGLDEIKTPSRRV